MPQYRVTGPDGKSYNVTAPDGTTSEQALARVRSQVNSKRDTVVGEIDALGRGAADMASFGLADKIAAAGNAVLPLDRLTGRNVRSVWDGSSLGDAFRSNLRLEQGVDAADAEVNPAMRTTGQIAGALVGPVPGRGLIAKGAAKIGKAPQLTRTLGEAAVQSGLYGMGKGDSTSITDRLQSGASDAAKGTAGALAGYGLVRGAARAISPRVAPEVADLANAGVVMTPGQRGGRLSRWLENASESIPGVGVPVRAAKGRGVEQFNKAWANEALKPIKAALPANVKAGTESVKWAQTAVSKAYDDALSGISAPADDAFSRGMANIAEKAEKLPPDQSGAFKAIMQLRVMPLIAGKQNIDGKSFQGVYRALQKDIAGFRNKGDPVADLTAESLQEVLDNFMDLADRHAGSSTTAFRAANEASARLARVEDAAARAQSVGGVFSPSTAASAAARKGYGTTRQNLARGEARMQRLADAAKAVLPDTVPNSGTAERAGLLALLGASGTGAATVNPWLALPAVGLARYAPGVDRVMQKAALRGQGKSAQTLADVIRQRAYIGGAIGTPALLQKRD
jgi:hypothetical protein